MQEQAVQEWANSSNFKESSFSRAWETLTALVFDRPKGRTSLFVYQQSYMTMKHHDVSGTTRLFSGRSTQLKCCEYRGSIDGPAFGTLTASPYLSLCKSTTKIFVMEQCISFSLHFDNESPKLKMLCGWGVTGAAAVCQARATRTCKR